MLDTSVLVHLILVAGLLVCLLMSALWLLHFPLKNAAIVDVGWTAGFPLVALSTYYLGNTDLRSALITLMSLLWAGRLGSYLFFTRIFRAPEEGRYTALREKWRTNIGAKFFAFYQFQALTVVLLSIPYFLVGVHPQPVEWWDEIHIVEWMGIVVFLVGWVGETTADLQLHLFKKDPANHGKVCDKGLWYYSRHPNYFFEIVVWLGVGLFAATAPFGWLAFAPALILSYFIFRVTGIPATEEQALRSKGEAYAEYQRTTSVFVPWFKKKP